MQSDALHKVRHAVRHVTHNPGSQFQNLKEAYLQWLIQISELSVPQEVLPDFRRLMQRIGELSFLNGPLSEKRASELIIELRQLEERLAV